MHHCDFFVQCTGRFIHLNLIAFLIRKARKAKVPSGVVAPCLDLGCQNVSFFRKVLTFYDQACATASDQNCSLRPPRLRCTVRLRPLVSLCFSRMSPADARLNGSFDSGRYFFSSALKCIFLIQKLAFEKRYGLSQTSFQPYHSH